jgi:hypothetical protein
MFLRPIRTAIAAYENWNHAPLTHAQAAAALGRLLAQPPSEFDNRIFVERASSRRTRRISTAAAEETQRIEELIATLEQEARKCTF